MRLYNEAVHFTLGILFVHGIGQQARGETLTGFGEPLIDWIDKWAAGGAVRRPALRLDDALVRPDPQDPSAPPYVIGQWRGSEGEPRAVLLAESWWADAFLAPSFGELLAWVRYAAFVTISLHFGSRFRRAWKARRESRGKQLVGAWLVLVREAVYFLVGSWVLSLSAALVLAVLGVTSVIPGLGGTVRRMQLALAGTLGDSYVLLMRPIQRAAIVGQLRRDLAWMARRCDRVAIVAHSQGAAVAHLALREGLPEPLGADRSCLITFGSGLKKLEELRWVHAQGDARGLWSALAAAIMVVGISWIRGWLPVSPPSTGTALWAGVGFVLAAVLWVADLALSFMGAPLDADALRPPVPWTDLYASSDPVSNGPLFDEEHTPDYLRGRTHEVHNRYSNRTDHGTYWKNPEEFISRVALGIASLAEIPLGRSENDDLALYRARWRRMWRVRLLGYARAVLSVALGCATVMLAVSGRLSQFGARVFAEIQQWQQRVPVNWLRDQFTAWFAWLPAPVVGAIAAAVVVSALFFVLIKLPWRRWDAFAIRASFTRADVARHETGFGFFALGSLVLIDVVVLVALGLLPLPGESLSVDSGRALVLTLVPGALSSLQFVRMALTSESWHGLGRRFDDASWTFGVLGGMNVLLSVPVMAVVLRWLWSWPGLNPSTPWSWVGAIVAMIVPRITMHALAGRPDRAVDVHLGTGTLPQSLSGISTNSPRVRQAVRREIARLEREIRDLPAAAPTASASRLRREAEAFLERLSPIYFEAAAGLRERLRESSAA